MAVLPTVDREAEIAALWMAYRVSQRAYVDHMRFCAVCDGSLCPEAQRLMDDADAREKALPYDAAKIALAVELRRAREADDDWTESRIPPLAAIVVASLAGAALFWVPVIVTYWPLIRTYWR